MLSTVLFGLIAAIFVVGQMFLVRSAWLLWRREASLPAGVPRSKGGTDLAWTLVTAALTGMMLYYAFLALPA
jgi:hypothetical protein